MYIALIYALSFLIASSMHTDCCVSKFLFDMGLLSFFMAMICGALILYSWVSTALTNVSEVMTYSQWSLSDDSLWLAAVGMICVGASQWLFWS